jgi:hypothetical protein
MRLLRGYVGALSGQTGEMSETARDELARIAWALDGGVTRRLAALRMPGFRRQTWLETLLFRLWFLLK